MSAGPVSNGEVKLLYQFRNGDACLLYYFSNGDRCMFAVSVNQ